MTPEQWQQVKKVLAAALERAPEERQAYLDGASAEPSLRREVESLIAAHEQGDSSFLERPAAEGGMLKSGTKLGPCEILALLGAGGMGEVYRARDTRLERDVAVKVLPPDLLADEAARRRFRNEALALAKLNHANIGVVYEFDTQGDLDFLVMEYVPGATLAEHLTQGALPEKEVAALGMQIAAALEEAHEHGLVHRDLKPGNIMVTPKGQAKVLDFGLARLLRPMSQGTAAAEALTETQGLAGTLPYMAPEQLRGELADARTDIHAAGAVLYEMATGQRPFSQGQGPTLIPAILSQQPRAPRSVNPRVSEALENIILKALDKEPENRYQSAKELGVDLRRLAAPTLPVVRPAARPRRVRRGPTPEPGNKRRMAVTAGVAAFLIVAALAAWRVFFARPALTQTDIILLASFVNKTGDPTFDNSLDKALEVKLTESPFLSLLPEADVRATMGMMRHDPKERVTRELGIEICKRQGLKAVVVPEIAVFGSRYLITLEAIDARNQKSIARRQEEAKTKDKVIGALGKAGSQLRRLLGESLSSLEKYNAPLDLATTSSLEALQAYRTGQTLYRSGKRREAIAFFERAVELDPQFCSAYSMLGSVYHSLGDDQASRKNFARAFELKDRRLTQEENFQTTALYHSSITGNLEKETAVVVLYKQAYPRSVFAYNLLGIAYAQLGRTEEALQEFNWTIEHSPVPSAQHYSNASQALMILGRFDDAKKLLDQWRQKGSLTPFQTMLRYRIAFFENDAATMERLARETPADDMPWLHLQMQLAFLRGDFTRLRSLSETLVNQDRRAKRMENVASELAWHASLESYVGNYALARKLCRQAGEASQDSAPGLWTCAKALGDVGEVTQADALVAKLDRLFPEDTLRQKVLLPIVRSIIERKRGNTVKAVDLLAPVTQYPNVVVFYHRAQAYLAAGEPAKAAADFEKVIGHRGWPEWEVFAPLAQLGLARAYAMQGDRENSRKAYEDFLTTWKDAHPDIPILRQAKAEYKKLTATASAAASASGKKQ